ncbi:uncharacterized protein LOC131950254 [Physella acuta]|uniref:uncharacterized protein LOC131950254 n=1 Tax=Physella acuta TaxID=109671 RepID=UPI0027DC3241|nr:uncharacterized protein LOC131950254 [Physella acuta]
MAQNTKSKTRKKKKIDTENDPMLINLNELIISSSECDNTDKPASQAISDYLLRDYLKKHVEELYPSIGKETYRVPYVHFNKVQSKQDTADRTPEVQKAHSEETDKRSDRAHSRVGDAVYHLSLDLTKEKDEKVCPFFIISSYQYDNYLSELKDHLAEADIKLPQGCGVQRGEADIIIILLNHVIFVEVKATGDNLAEYKVKKETIQSTIKKAEHQLERDRKIFDYIFSHLDLKSFKFTEVIAFPNLDRSLVTDVLGTNPFVSEHKEYKFLCKEDMPDESSGGNLERFKTWWSLNVFTENTILQDVKAREEALDNMKSIIGCYVGFFSVVELAPNSKLRKLRVEGRRKGQSVLHVGNQFSAIVLNGEQSDYSLATEKLGYLCGPPGSGKTVVLAVKARRWILDGSQNYVVIVNMYRGAAGRVIGKQIVKLITEVTDAQKKEKLQNHCVEIPVNVDKFQKDEFVRSVNKQVTHEGQDFSRVLFIVDETYVKSYWEEVFNTLRSFDGSGLWCAGLYGKQPQGFKEMLLNKVIRCPPKIQRVLKLIDWDERRVECYCKDSASEVLPSDGPTVLTVRHLQHASQQNVSPLDCSQCGKELVKLLQDEFNVEKPGMCHTQPDLAKSSLKCSDIVFLVNLPRTCYKPDEAHYLDTTDDEYKSYMKNLKQSVMLKELNTAGYPLKIHTEFLCSELTTASPAELINVVWIYAYQGLENKVVIFIPGDEAMPENTDKDYLKDATLNIPCPGLKGAESNDSWTCICKENDSHLSEIRSNADDAQNKDSCRGKTIADFHFKDEDVDRYTRWDKNGLFISASRCTSQLILVTR